MTGFIPASISLANSSSVCHADLSTAPKSKSLRTSLLNKNGLQNTLFDLFLHAKNVLYYSISSIYHTCNHLRHGKFE